MTWTPPRPSASDEGPHRRIEVAEAQGRDGLAQAAHGLDQAHRPRPIRTAHDPQVEVRVHVQVAHLDEVRAHPAQRRDGRLDVGLEVRDAREDQEVHADEPPGLAHGLGQHLRDGQGLPLAPLAERDHGSRHAPDVDQGDFRSLVARGPKGYALARYGTLNRGVATGTRARSFEASFSAPDISKKLD